MKKLPLIAALAALLTMARAFALTPSEWRFHQSIEIEKAGPARILLPLETLDKLAPDLRDLRLVDASGKELSCATAVIPWIDAPPVGECRALSLPVEMRLDEARRKTVVTITTGTDAPVESVRLLIPDTIEYTVAARLEISDDGQAWESLGDGWPILRRNRADGTTAFTGGSFVLKKMRKAPYIRVTMPTGASPIAVTGAEVTCWTGGKPPPQQNIMTTPAAIVGIEEKSGETIVRLDLGATNLAADEVTLDVADPLFTRRVYCKRDDLRWDYDSTIYRFPAGGGTNAEETRVVIGGKPTPSREIELRIENKDSAPLHLRGATVSWWPVYLVFNATAPGRYDLLSGNPVAARRDYDIQAILRKMYQLDVTPIKAGPLVETPDYRAPAPPRDLMKLAGNALFGIALAAVVIVLLAVVAKLLPVRKG